MGFSLRDFLEESAAQINPFDKGKTAQTVRAARKAPTPTVNKSEQILKPLRQKASKRLYDRYKAGELNTAGSPLVLNPQAQQKYTYENKLRDILGTQNVKQPPQARSTVGQIAQPLIGSVVKTATSLPANIGSLIGTAIQDPGGAAIRSLSTVNPAKLSIDAFNAVSPRDLPNPFKAVEDRVAGVSTNLVRKVTPDVIDRGQERIGRGIEDASARYAGRVEGIVEGSDFQTTPRPGENKVTTNLASGAGSLTTSLVASRFGGAKAAGGLFGLTAAGGQTRGARDAGFSPSESLAIGVQAGAAEFALEKAGLNRFLKNLGGNKIIASTIKNSITEGVQETAQSIAQSGIEARYQDVDWSDAITQAFVEGAYGAVLGGGITSISTISNNLQSKGIPSDVAQDIANKVVSKYNETDVSRAKLSNTARKLATSQVAKSDPEFKRHDDNITKAFENAAQTTGKLRENYKIEAKESQRLRNAVVKSYSEIGAIGRDVRPDSAKQPGEQLELVGGIPKTVKINVIQRGGEKKIKVGGYTVPKGLEGDIQGWNDAGSVFKNMDRNLQQASKMSSQDWQDSKTRDFFITDRETAVTDMTKDHYSILSEKKQVEESLGVKGTEMNADVQIFGEGRMTKQELVAKWGVDKANSIEQMDKWYRNQYQKLWKETNSKLSKFGQANIPWLDNYYTHFQDDNLWSSFGLRVKEVASGRVDLADIGVGETRGKGIDPKLVGQSQFTNPNKRWNPFAQKRLGAKHTDNASKAFETYLAPTLHNKHLTESAMRAKELKKAVQNATVDSKHLNTLLTQIDEHQRKLAGKSARLDRIVTETKSGEKVMKANRIIMNAVGRNTIVGNMGSAVVQVAALPQATAHAGAKNTALAITQQAKFSLTGNKNDPALKSDFLSRRYTDLGSTQPSIKESATKVASVPFNLIEETTGTVVWRSEYNKALEEGKNETEAIKQADFWAQRILAGRQVGEKPELYETKAATVATMFTLEVNNINQQILQDLNKKQIAKLFGAFWLMNTALFEPLLNRRVLLDPIQAVVEAGGILGDDEDEKSTADKVIGASGRLVGEVAGNIPGATLAAGLLFDDKTDAGRKIKRDFFGDTDIGRFAGSNPIKTLIENPQYLILPFGGGQLKKTKSGVDLERKGYSETDSEQIRFTTPDSPLSKVQGLVFGQYTTSGGRKYIESDFKRLTGEDAEQFKALPRHQQSDFLDKKLAGKAEKSEKKKIRNRNIERLEESGVIGGDLPKLVGSFEDKIQRVNDDKYISGYDTLEEYAKAKGLPDGVKSAKKIAAHLSGDYDDFAEAYGFKPEKALNEYEAVENRDDFIATARSMFDGTKKYELLPEKTKNEYLKRNQITRKQVDYDVVANYSAESKAEVFFNKFKNLPHKEVYRRLLEGRARGISGSQLASDKTLRLLRDMGMISNNEYKELKRYDSKDGDTTVKRKSTKGKSRKSKFDITKLYSSGGTSRSSLNKTLRQILEEASR